MELKSIWKQLVEIKTQRKLNMQILKDDGEERDMKSTSIPLQPSSVKNRRKCMTYSY